MVGSTCWKPETPESASPSPLTPLNVPSRWKQPTHQGWLVVAEDVAAECDASFLDGVLRFPPSLWSVN